MKKIKVICGGCGIRYKETSGRFRYTHKTAEDKPFECEDAQAERLVSLGIAEYVETPASNGEETAIYPKEDMQDVHFERKDLEAMDYNDLRKLAAELGVEAEGKKKADYIEAIMAHYEEDEFPELTAMLPE